MAFDDFENPEIFMEAPSQPAPSRAVLIERAIEQSERGEWEESVASNEAILALEPQDVAALNRLGRSLTKLGRLREALDAYERSVGVDPANAIALRNVAKLRGMLDVVGDDTVPAANGAELRAEHFIMETGRSAVLSLENLGSAEQLATLLPGDLLELRQDGSRLKLYATGGGEVGSVPADRAHRLIELINGGNTYAAAVVRAGVDSVDVLIRETYRSAATQGKLPFPTTTRTIPESRAALAGLSPAIAAEEEFEGEPDIDEDAEDAEETTTEPLADAEDTDEVEE